MIFRNRGKKLSAVFEAFNEITRDFPKRVGSPPAISRGCSDDMGAAENGAEHLSNQDRVLGRDIERRQYYLHAPTRPGSTNAVQLMLRYNYRCAVATRSDRLAFS